jgi:hypothetical protein
MPAVVQRACFGDTFPAKLSHTTIRRNKMKIGRIGAVLLGIALLTAGAGYYAVHADEWDKTTKVTFNEPVQVPGAVLPAGTYIFKLYDSTSNRHIVRIFKEDQATLVTTILAIPNYRLEPTDKTILTYSERPVNEPEALNAWFYPGDNSGQQFVYPKSQAAELSRLNHVEVPSSESEERYPGNLEKTSAPVASQKTEVAENRAAEPHSSQVTEKPQPAASAPSPAYQPTPNSSATQVTARQQQTQRLPQTASTLPVIGLVGFVFLGVALALKIALRS